MEGEIEVEEDTERSHGVDQLPYLGFGAGCSIQLPFHFIYQVGYYLAEDFCALSAFQGGYLPDNFRLGYGLELRQGHG